MGYTKLAGGVTTRYHQGDEYLAWRYHTYMMPRIEQYGTSVVLSDQRASRVAEVERNAQYLLLGFDAPFVFTLMNESVTCGNGMGKPAVTAINIGRTEFPATNLYVNDHLVSYKRQALGRGRLADFIVSGGTDYHPHGIGNLAPLGGGMTWEQAGSRITICPPTGSRALAGAPRTTGTRASRALTMHRLSSRLVLDDHPSFRLDDRAGRALPTTIVSNKPSRRPLSDMRLTYAFKPGQRLTY